MSADVDTTVFDDDDRDSVFQVTRDILNAADTVRAYVPESYARQVALDKLREAAHWATDAIFNGDHEEDDTFIGFREDPDDDDDEDDTTDLEF